MQPITSGLATYFIALSSPSAASPGEKSDGIFISAIFSGITDATQSRNMSEYDGSFHNVPLGKIRVSSPTWLGVKVSGCTATSSSSTEGASRSTFPRGPDILRRRTSASLVRLATPHAILPPHKTSLIIGQNSAGGEMCVGTRVVVHRWLLLRHL